MENESSLADDGPSGPYCQQCGARPSPTAKFCPECGAAVGTQPQDEEDGGGTRRPWVLVAAAALLLVVLGAVFVLAIRDDDGTDVASTDAAAPTTPVELAAELLSRHCVAPVSVTPSLTNEMQLEHLKVFGFTLVSETGYPVGEGQVLYWNVPTQAGTDRETLGWKPFDTMDVACGDAIVTSVTAGFAPADEDAPNSPSGSVAAPETTTTTEELRSESENELPGCPGAPQEVSAEQAAECLYAAWRAGERDLAAVYAAADAVAAMFEFEPDGEPQWQFDGCTEEGGAPPTCWWFIPDDFHGVGVEMVVDDTAPGGALIESVSFYG